MKTLKYAAGCLRGSGCQSLVELRSFLSAMRLIRVPVGIGNNCTCSSGSEEQERQRDEAKLHRETTFGCLFITIPRPGCA